MVIYELFELIFCDYARINALENLSNLCDAFITELDIQTLLFYQVFTSWREIAETIRNRVLKEDEQHLIDIFDIEVISPSYFATLPVQKSGLAGPAQASPGRPGLAQTGHGRPGPARASPGQ